MASGSDRPLVSVVITTYNSADFVVETLESVKQQSWTNLELIVSDDSSSDHSVEICRAWLDRHGDRFVRTELLTVPANTGVSANCNRGIRAAASDWIKFIAGDDILLPNCIEDNMAYVGGRPDALVVFSQVHVYRERFEEDCFLRTTPDQFPDNLMRPDYSPRDQFEILLLSDRIHYTPSYFFNRRAVLAVGGYDEQNRLIEDYPMWLKLTQAGYRLHFFLTPTVGYRMHDRALNNRVQQYLIKPNYRKAHLVRKRAAHAHLPWEIVARENFSHLVTHAFYRLGLNGKGVLLKWSHKVLTNYLNPFFYIFQLKKRLRSSRTHSHFYH